MDEQDEAEISDGLRRGDTDAWRRLYDAHAERVWRLVARAMQAGSTDVADVVQETFLAAARSASSYDPTRGSLSVWLNGIARRQIALHYRRRKRRFVFFGASVASPNSTAGNAVHSSSDIRDPTETVNRAEVASQIRNTLNRLPEDYEVLLTLKYLDELSVREIALAERSSEQAIRSKLARARQAFRDMFRRCYPDPIDNELRGAP
jgi:RNA polymerase sigma-70 factor, ECF subfamily